MSHWEMPATEPPPLKIDADGTVRITGTRVTLDTVVGAFNDGCTAEEIMLQYPSLQLPQIYAVLAYDLNHREPVDAYLQQREQEAVEVRRKVEEWCPRDGYRERLLARRSQKA